MNKRDISNSKEALTNRGRKVSKKILQQMHDSRPAVISDVSQGVIVSDANNFSGAPLPLTHQWISIQNINGLYVSSNNAKSGEFMTCDKTQPTTAWQSFLPQDQGDGKIALNTVQGFVSRNGDSPMISDRSAASGWETFSVIDNGDGTFSLMGDNGKYVSSENGTGPMTCNRDTIGGWEKFVWNNWPPDSSTSPIGQPVVDTTNPPASLPASTQGTIDQKNTVQQQEQQSVMTGGKYWWLWYVVAIIIVIIYVKYYRK